MEFVIEVCIGRKKSDCNDGSEPLCIPVHSHDALKGRPRVLRTVKPLFRLPGAPPYVL